MAYTRSFAQLSLAVQQLGQWEGSTDITSAVLLQGVNYGLLEGYDLMVQKWRDYYTIDTTFALVNGTASYVLATVAPNFYKLRHLDYTADLTVTANSRFVDMVPHEIDGAHVYSGMSATNGRPPKYRIQGANLVFAPLPGTGTVRVFYIPLAPQFASTVDATLVTFDVPVEERLVVQLAQREILERNDLDTSDCDRKVAKLSGQLRTAADSRDAGKPMFFSPTGPPRDRSFRGFGDDEF
jgi:hypothetical protein